MELYKMLGDIIGGIGKIVGGFMGQNEAENTREAQLNMARDNYQHQKEFAQHGIRWKVDDAKAAGLHPIYALGGSGASFSPSSANFTADTSMANAVAGAGQDLGRAINSTRTEGERGDAFTKTARALQLENMSLQNDNLRSEIASKVGRLRQNPNPPMPSPGDAWLVPGQAQSGLIKNEPMKRTNPGDEPSNEPGAITDTGYVRTKSGGYVPLPSKDAKERIEDIMPHEWSHFWRNNIMPHFGGRQFNPPYKAPEGKEWVYDLTDGYRLVPHRMEKYRRDMQRFTPRSRSKDYMGSFSTNF